MGLDMYLKVKEYNVQHNLKEADKYNTIMQTVSIKGMKEVPIIVSTEYTVIYWRKANQVHGWFVDKLADGVDECQRISVSRDNLVKLHETCSVLLDTRSNELARELLPPTDGFFFQAGGGEAKLDEGYWLDLQHTHEELSKLLEQITEENKWDYNIEYQASW
jgi:hypothetical protein